MLAIITSHPIQYQAPLWRALAAAGVKFEVWFLTPHAVKASFDREFGKSFAWDVDLLAGYPHRFLPIAPGWRLDHFRGVRLRSSWADEFRARGVTHVWVEGWRLLEFWRAIMTAHNVGMKVWLRGETNDISPRRGLRDAARRLSLKWLFARVDRFLCIGTSNRRFYRGFGVPDSRLHAAPYCVDNARFAHAALELRAKRYELRGRWNVDPEAFVPLFCGKLIPKKRPLDVVAAVSLAAADPARPWHLLFAGDGELATSLREALVKANLAGTITGFLNQTEIPAAYVVADCLVLPSDAGETWGLVVNEALASGLPPIVSDQCGCAEDLARPLGDAHVFPCGDVAALVRCIGWVKRHPPSAEVLDRVAAGHSPSRTAETVCSLLTER